MVRRVRRCFCSIALVCFVVLTSLAAGLMSTRITSRSALAASDGCNAVNALTDFIPYVSDGLGVISVSLPQLAYDAGEHLNFISLVPITGGPFNTMTLTYTGVVSQSASAPVPGGTGLVVTTTGPAFVQFSVTGLSPGSVFLAFACTDTTPDPPTPT